MKPETRTVNELFERDVRYVVPLYQRPYVWSQEDQWEPLWADILVLVEHYLGNGGQTSSYSHFLGAIVLEQETQAPGKVPVYTVIDGQQRLTTLQLVLSAAKAVAEEFDAAEDAGILGDLIINDAKKAAGDLRLKVWPTNVNRRAFRSVVLPQDEAAVADDPDNLIQEAHEFFRRSVAQWVADDEPEGIPKRLTALRVTLSDLLKVVSITLEPGDNAQIIFETLNARGTPLLALDLVKNAVFHQATKEGHNVDQLYGELWQPELEQDLWREQRRQGRLLRAHGELFLMHWLGMKLRRVIPATELFTTFRKDVLGAVPPPRMDALIRELNQHAEIYRGFENQPVGSPEALFFDRLEALDVSTMMPLVLWLFTHPQVTVARRREVLRLLESWLVRRMLLRLTTKNYNSEVVQMLAKVEAEPARVDEVMRAHLAGADSETNRSPKDEEIVAHLKTADVYGAISQSRVAMVLRAVELSLYDSLVDLPTIPNTLWIEHVMPQEWSKHWKLSAGLSSEERARLAEERDSRLHRLGNLTLTSMRMNIDLSNSAWAKKQKKLNHSGKLLLNVELIEKYGNNFEEAAIDQRSRNLARRICTIWREP